MDVSTVNGFQVSAEVGTDLGAEGEPAINDTLPDRVILPEPDPDNITVLTHELPNDPILPWHHFDSPWLAEGEEGAGETAATETEVGDRPVSPTPTPPLPTAESDPAAATAPLVTAEPSMPTLDAAIAPPPDTLPDSLG